MSLISPSRRSGRIAHRRLHRVAIVLFSALAVLATDAALVQPPVASAATKARAAKDVPPMRSEPPAYIAPEIPAGDFRNPPDPSQAPPAPSAAASFDPATSTPLAEETTPTRRVWRNADGTETAEVSAKPTRFQDTSGAWHDIDVALVPAGDDLVAKAAPDSAILAATADGEVATAPTSAGPIALRHPGALEVAASTDKDTATYAKALPGSRDLKVVATPDGFKDTVVLPDAKAPASSPHEFVLSPGMTVREGDDGVDFVDATGAVVAHYGGGIAFDAAFESRGLAAATPVSIRLQSLTATVATVVVSIDEAWLGAKDRKFPVSIDPTFTATTHAPWGRDTFVASGDWSSISFSANPYTWVGSDNAHLSRTLLWFDTSTLPVGTDVAVTQANVNISNWWTVANSCTPRPVSVYGLSQPFTSATTWANQPAAEAALVSTRSFAHSANAGQGCPMAPEALDVTTLARRWLRDGAPNHGLTVRAGSSPTEEAVLANYKGFFASEAAGPPGTPSPYIPTLSITYTRLPTPSAPVSPPSDSVLVDPTPTLTATTATDPPPNPGPVQYWFRVGISPQVEGGHAIDSGWVNTPSWTVPHGALRDGTYYWHVFTWDGFAEGYFTSPTAPPASFRTTLRLSGGPAPTDTVGAATVNLASGNLTAGHASPTFPTVGGPVGLTFAYNSQAPVTGLAATYYPDPGTHAFTAAPVLSRVDPNVAFNWGTTTPPRPGLPTDNYMVRWTGKIKTPTSGSYRLYVGTTDGVRVKLGPLPNQTTVINRWSEPGTPNNDTIVGAPYNFPGAAVDITVEYFEGTGNAAITLGALDSFGAAKLVEPGWLSPTPLGPLPTGWTFSAGAGAPLRYVGARLSEHGVTLVDGTGGLHTYTTGGTTSAGAGYTPPLGEDGVLGTDDVGNLTLADGGAHYVFDANTGRLAAAGAATDDANPSSPCYSWATSPPRLRQILDPAGGRTVVLRYFGDSAATVADPCRPGQTMPVAPCPAPPAGFFSADGQLCQVEYWDGTKTMLRYDQAARLVRFEEPGGAVSDFAYDGHARLTGMRDPLTLDAMAANATTGVPTDENNNTTRTVITYEGAPPQNRVTALRLPVPNAGAPLPDPRPGHTYSYGTGQTLDYGSRQTLVHVDGLSGSVDEPYGFNRRAEFDSGGRSTADTDATDKRSTKEWDGDDRLRWATDIAGRRSTTVYDGDASRIHGTGRVTDTFGPASASCFDEAAVPDGSCTNPPPAHVAVEYDRTFANDADATGTAVEGLAVAYFANRTLAGLPRAHAEAAPSVGTGSMLPPALPTGLVANAWSARYTGEIDAAGPQTFTLVVQGQGRLYVDDVLVVDAWAASGTVSGPTTLGPGRHRLRLDYATAAAGATQIELRWGGGPVPASALAPRYANPAKTTTDDTTLGVSQRVTTSSYETMAGGLVNKVNQDPGGLSLVTQQTLEAAGAGTFMRRSSRTLPAGPATTTNHVYYTSASLSPPVAAETRSNPCPAGGSANQGGMAKLTTPPDPDGPNGPRTTEAVYDAAGRLVASRVSGGDWTCTEYDGRGRATKRSFPGPSARTVTYTHQVKVDPDPNKPASPLVGEATDPAGTIRTTVDLLGRVTAYRDALGQTTTSTYHQSGRPLRSNGPQGRIDNAKYDPNGRLEEQRLADAGSLLEGPVVAAPQYNPITKELQSVAYGNTTSLSLVGRDLAGRPDHLAWTGPGGAAIAEDEVQRSQAGRVVNEAIDGVDPKPGPGPANDNFVYDAVGRLTQAWVPGHALTYGFGDAPCPFATAGKNANRTSVSDNGAPPLTYCYDSTDRLTSSSDPGAGSPTYDARGNTIQLGAQTIGYDGAGRHTSTSVQDGPTVTYVRDATDRIVERTEGAITTRYGYAGPGDGAAFTMNTSNQVQSRFIALPGGALLTKSTSGSGDVWSYPNLHGDVIAIANASGAKQGGTLAYDPFGIALAPLFGNAPENFDYGWLGQHQRGTEHAAGITTVEMGARQYVPTLGRFLSVDPVEAGSCGDYDYVCGDPVNATDLGGTEAQAKDPPPELYARCVDQTPYDEAFVLSSTCDSVRAAVFDKMVGRPYDYSEPVEPIPPPPSGGYGPVGDFLHSALVDTPPAALSDLKDFVTSTPVQVAAHIVTDAAACLEWGTVGSALGLVGGGAAGVPFKNPVGFAQAGSAIGAVAGCGYGVVSTEFT